MIGDRVAPGAPVGVRPAGGADALVSWLACLAVGSPAVLLDAADAPERFAGIAVASRLAAVISDRPVPGFDVIAAAGHPPAPLKPRQVDPGDPAFVVWTSGSTGAPKGIVQSQRSVLFRSGMLVNSRWGGVAPADAVAARRTLALIGHRVPVSED